jgi:diguanylate cyclase (GGDEF)-like protein
MGPGTMPSVGPSRSALSHLLTVALGALGWAVVLGLPAVGALDPVAPAGPRAVALFVVVILAARALAFRLVEGSVLSLDTAYYVAATLCVGPIAAGRLVALALTLDALARLIVAHRRGGVDRRWWAQELGYVLYFGGMSAGLLVVVGWVFDGDGLAAHRPDGDAIAVHVVAIGAVFLTLHYAVQGVRSKLLGKSWRRYLRDLAVPGVVSEMTLMPIGVVLVLLYDPDEPLGFLLLSATYLLINFVFGQLSKTSTDLHQRVHELEVLHGSARRLAASLQLEELVVAVAREACRAIPEAEAVALVHRDVAPATGYVLDGYDRGRERFFRRRFASDEGLTGWVLAHGVPRREGELERREPDAADSAGASSPGGPAVSPSARSWLGVPLKISGDVDGVIAVQSAHPHAFRLEHERLLASLGLLIGSALQNARLYELAMVDGLTGLFMRRYFDARIEEEMERTRRYGTPFSVVMMDVDDFKRLNDTHGHVVGDRVLRTIAEVVKDQMRGVDTAARYGGEEVAVILPRTEMLDAYHQAERIRAAIAAQRVATDDPATTLTVTASFGIAAYPESAATSGEDLVRRADRALYRAKQLGKNRVELYWSDAGDAASDADGDG